MKKRKRNFTKKNQKSFGQPTTQLNPTKEEG